ncbi:DNA-binding protein WhiA [Vallitalea okinawensis]|uniref:DNA-binding protein WhiA n=1 Tax=Vallitalea okinawensis TaxID=2078660 RepID=UPI000CFB542B|nr:DNA-binding protein WhiA [Vallitalea okinawensis]
MSFSSKVKNELARHVGKARHCSIAEIAAIIKMCGHVEVTPAVSIVVHTENPSVAKKFYLLLKETFKINPEIAIRKNVHLGKSRNYILHLNNPSEASRVLQATKMLDISDNGQIKTIDGINSLIVQSTCCKRAYIRGAFLGGGSVSDPEKNYHLEFVNTSEEHCKALQKIIHSFELDAKIVRRKKYFVLYMKDGTQIVDMFNIMGAHVALMDLENVRIVKEMRNNVNRIVNCETANLNKTVSAAVKQLEDINYIESIIGLDKLPSNLEEVARIRQIYTDASLKELGAMLDPVVGKSGVNHRLRKISNIAEKLRKEREGVI